ncbi:hypothetical protein SDC9_103917 [bioreactor metagenome]|uniref:Uncharacterized protein n=1 Tax=bioreactor metagenome TaxID=1076179 RepID=A0A645AVG3_9ZZZZ
MGQGTGCLSKVHQALLFGQCHPISAVVSVDAEHQEKKPNQRHRGDDTDHHDHHLAVVIVLAVKVEIEHIREIYGSGEQAIFCERELSCVQEDGEPAETDVLDHSCLGVVGSRSTVTRTTF